MSSKEDDERKERIAELKAQLKEVEKEIAHFESIQKILTDSRQTMNEYKTQLSDNVSILIDNYDIDGEDEWRGINKDLAQVSYEEIVNQKSDFDSEIGGLDSDIETGINNATKKLEQLNRERSIILSELQALGA